MGNTARTDRLQINGMIAEGGSIAEPTHPPSDAAGPDSGKIKTVKSADDEAVPESAQAATTDGFAKLGQKLRTSVFEYAEKVGRRTLGRLNARRRDGAPVLATIPDRMHRVANETGLLLELLDDFRSGAYRDISWVSIAVLSGGLLYAINPADVVPNFIPFVGQIDDLVVLAAVTRYVRDDLIRYCVFKGYPLEEHFTRDEWAGKID